MQQILSQEYLILKQGPKKGGYDITGIGGGHGSIMFMVDKKPKWHHRFFTKLFLGWAWVDGKK